VNECFDVCDVMRTRFLLRVFDPGRLLVVRVGILIELIIKLRVFDPDRLFVVRVGNLNELIMKLRVFDPGRLLVVRVGILIELIIKLRVFDPAKGGELKRINHEVKGVRPRPLTCGKGGELK